MTFATIGKACRLRTTENTVYSGWLLGMDSFAYFVARDQDAKNVWSFRRRDVVQIDYDQSVADANLSRIERSAIQNVMTLQERVFRKLNLAVSEVSTKRFKSRLSLLETYHKLIRHIAGNYLNNSIVRKSESGMVNYLPQFVTDQQWKAALELHNEATKMFSSVVRKMEVCYMLIVEELRGCGILQLIDENSSYLTSESARLVIPSSDLLFSSEEEIDRLFEETRSSLTGFASSAAEVSQSLRDAATQYDEIDTTADSSDPKTLPGPREVTGPWERNARLYIAVGGISFGAVIVCYNLAEALSHSLFDTTGTVSGIGIPIGATVIGSIYLGGCKALDSGRDLLKEIETIRQSRPGA